MIKRVPVSMSFDEETIGNLKSLTDETGLSRSEIIRQLIKQAFYNHILVEVIIHQHQIEKDVEKKSNGELRVMPSMSTKKEMGEPDGNTQEPSSLSIENSLADYTNEVNYRHALKNCHTREEYNAVVYKRCVQLARTKWLDDDEERI